MATVQGPYGKVPEYRITFTTHVTYDGTPEEAAEAAYYFITHDLDPVDITVRDMDTGEETTVDFEEISRG